MRQKVFAAWRLFFTCESFVISCLQETSLVFKETATDNLCSWEMRKKWDKSYLFPAWPSENSSRKLFAYPWKKKLWILQKTKKMNRQKRKVKSEKDVISSKRKIKFVSHFYFPHAVTRKINCCGRRKITKINAFFLHFHSTLRNVIWEEREKKVLCSLHLSVQWNPKLHYKYLSVQFPVKIYCYFNGFKVNFPCFQKASGECQGNFMFVKIDCLKSTRFRTNLSGKVL